MREHNCRVESLINTAIMILEDIHKENLKEEYKIVIAKLNAARIILNTIRAECIDGKSR